MLVKFKLNKPLYSAYRDFTGGIGSRLRPGNLALSAVTSHMTPWNSVQFVLQSHVFPPFISSALLPSDLLWKCHPSCSVPTLREVEAELVDLVAVPQSSPLWFSTVSKTMVVLILDNIGLKHTMGEHRNCGWAWIPKWCLGGNPSTNNRRILFHLSVIII